MSKLKPHSRQLIFMFASPFFFFSTDSNDSLPLAVVAVEQSGLPGPPAAGTGTGSVTHRHHSHPVAGQTAQVAPGAAVAATFEASDHRRVHLYPATGGAHRAAAILPVFGVKTGAPAVAAGDRFQKYQSPALAALNLG